MFQVGLSYVTVDPYRRSFQILDYHLKPVMQRSWSCIKYSGNFIEKTKRIRNISEDAILATADVVRLYPSNPHKLGLKAVEEALEKKEFTS